MAMMTKIKTDYLKLGWYQIIGGIIGILIILYSVMSLTKFSGLIIFIYSFMLLFFAYSIYCGTLCVQNKNNALTHSLINQFLQILGFAIFGFAFTYVAGIYVSVGLDLSTSINMNFNFGISNFDFNINRERERTEINFNLVALGLIFWIDKLKNKVKEEETNIEISTIGQLSTATNKNICVTRAGQLNFSSRSLMIISPGLSRFQLGFGL